jgi:Flp pilus assembly protein TadG
MTSQIRSERGATALLVAMSLFLLMGMAALAVDLGSAFDDRRQQQSAADVGSLAAVQYANTNHSMPPACTGTPKVQAACRGAVEAIAVISGTLNNRFTAAQWGACVDTGDISAGYPTGSTVSDCISFTTNLQKARVVLPTTQVSTTFGRVLGINTIGISSFSEAGADLNSTSDVIPFALGPLGGGASQSCIFSNPNNGLDTAPCNGPTGGNFGFLDIAHYGNPELGTTDTCMADTQGRLARNITLGADHELTTYSPGDTIRNDATYCPIFTALPNEVTTNPGGSATGLENGFFYGSNLSEGRLLCKGSLSTDTTEENLRILKESSSCVSVKPSGAGSYPEFLDNTPLWEFIDPGAASVAPLCAIGGLDTRQEMEACLIQWKTVFNPTIALFTPDLMESPRFAAVPLLDNDPNLGSSGNYLIMDVLPVYIETIYLGCNSTACAIIHSPGETGPPTCTTLTENTCGVPAAIPGNQSLRAVTSFILELDMLPDEISDHWPSSPGTLKFNLIR